MKMLLKKEFEKNPTLFSRYKLYVFSNLRDTQQHFFELSDVSWKIVQRCDDKFSEIWTLCFELSSEISMAIFSRQILLLTSWPIIVNKPVTTATTTPAIGFKSDSIKTGNIQDSWWSASETVTSSNLLLSSKLICLVISKHSSDYKRSFIDSIVFCFISPLILFKVNKNRTK